MRVGRKWLERIERRAEEVATDRTREVVGIMVVPSRDINIDEDPERFIPAPVEWDRGKERAKWESKRAELERDESEEEGPGLKIKVIAPSYDEAVRRIQTISPNYEGVE